MHDHGPAPFVTNIEEATLGNDLYRRTLWTGSHLQLTVMAIEPGHDIGLEVHDDHDQFLRVEGGTARVQMGPAEDDLPFQQDVEDGWAVMVPAGTWHDIINTGDEPMRLYAIYAPVHHAPGIVQPTAEDAEADEQSGRDVPPQWSVQPDSGSPDQHA